MADSLCSGPEVVGMHIQQTTTGLTFRIAVYGDQDDTPQRAPRPKDVLPKVRITDDVDTVRAAFDALEREALLKAKRRDADKL